MVRDLSKHYLTAVKLNPLDIGTFLGIASRKNQMYDFLREYIESLPEEVRNDPEFGFELLEGIDTGKMHDLKQDLLLDLSEELEGFYVFSNGAQLGEYSVFSVNELDYWYQKLSKVYGDEEVKGLVPFALLKGVGDYIVIDSRNLATEEYPVLDGFHEYDPTQWKEIATGLRHWLMQMCESNFQPYWLKQYKKRKK